MATQWFCKIMGDEQGPMSASELQTIARSGQLAIDDLVRKHSGGTWVRAENVIGLFDRPTLPVVLKESIAVIDDFASIVATWQATTGMSAAGQLCSIEVNTSASRSGDSWMARSSTCENSTTVESTSGTRPRASSVVVPRRTLKVATGARAKAVAEKLANQTTQAAFNSAAETIPTTNVSRPAEVFAENACGV
jgi:hypothetical protein